MLLLFVPIGILVDLSEKIDKLKEFDVPFNEILDYYLNFIWYFGNTLYPIFVFLAVIWFTSKIANDSEITAILSSGISFNRYLKPFMVSATVVAVFALFQECLLFLRKTGTTTNSNINISRKIRNQERLQKYTSKLMIMILCM